MPWVQNVPGVISLQVIRDGLPQLVGTVPLRTGTARAEPWSSMYCQYYWNG